MSYDSMIEDKKWGDAIKHEYAISFSRESIIIDSGQPFILKQLTLLGQLTANDKYTPLNPSSSDGSEQAKAILYSNDVDARAADQNAIVLIRGPAIINFAELILVYELDENAIENAKRLLSNNNIISRKGA